MATDQHRSGAPPGALVQPRAIKDACFAAFANVSAPTSCRDIAPHLCDECDELARDLIGKRPSSLDGATLSYHCWDLPLLSASAKRYYLPAWIERSLDDLDSDYTQALLFDFESDHRHEGFDDAQRAAISIYLDYVAAHGDDSLRDLAVSAQIRWR